MTPTQHILLFVVDGMRPDGLQQAHTPTLDRLMQDGAATLGAQTVSPAVTLPCHASMFYGVTPATHGTTSNTWTPKAATPPGLIDLLGDAERDVAVFYTWEPLRGLWRPGSIDFGYLRHELHGDVASVMTRDREIGEVAAQYIPRHRPTLSFVYLGGPDLVGHHSGWMSAGYLEALHVADAIIGEVLEACRRESFARATTTLVLADHGGHDHGHGEKIAEDLTIPWILEGAGVRASHRLTQEVHIEDTAPTLLHLLGLPLPTAWTGQIVTEALL